MGSSSKEFIKYKSYREAVEQKQKQEEVKKRDDNLAGFDDDMMKQAQDKLRELTDKKIKRESWLNIMEGKNGINLCGYTDS